jgi:hypothetical protein
MATTTKASDGQPIRKNSTEPHSPREDPAGAAKDKDEENNNNNNNNNTAIEDIDEDLETNNAEI